MRFISRIDAARFQELVRPKLRLFLSVDINGSTDLKYQRSGDAGPEWVVPLLNFYTAFPEFLKTAVKSESSSKKKAVRKNVGSMKSPDLWKALGDELIFVAELEGRQDAARHVRAFRTALQKAAANWAGASGAGQLRFKGTAWLAGFPIGNAEMPVADASSQAPLMPDFVGPQMDAGFRLKDQASQRKLVLSADLAYLLLRAGGHGLNLYFHGDESLRGVMRGKPYPVIWVDCEQGDDRQEPTLNQKKDRLIGRKPADEKLLRSYLEAWLDGCGNEVPKPFIAKDPFKDLCQPGDYDNKFQAWVAKWRGTLLVHEEVLPENESAKLGTKLPPNLEKLLG
ncbi:MAG: hypothetical protein JWO94_3173 [Verrucomicrobiaceae bacterium]|nr:hypothetical protein [Verrucomicrobiaceae bacterium]